MSANVVEFTAKLRDRLCNCHDDISSERLELCELCENIDEILEEFKGSDKKDLFCKHGVEGKCYYCNLDSTHKKD